MLQAKRIIIIVLLSATLLSPQSTSADYWGGANSAGAVKQMAEVLALQLRDALKAAAKQAAVQVVTETMRDLLSDGDGSLIITDPYDYVFLEPERRTQSYMNDFFSLAARGRDSKGNYAGAESGAGALNYEGELVAGAKASLGYGGGDQPFGATLREFCPKDNPKNIFDDGNWACANAIFSNPYNNPYGFAIESQKAATAEYARQSALTSAELASGEGFKNKTDENGNVLTPGSIIKDLQAEVAKLPLKIIATSDSEAVAIMFEAIAVSAMTKVVTEGIGNVGEQNQRANDDSSESASQEIDESVEANGPGVIFNSDEIYDGS